MLYPDFKDLLSFKKRKLDKMHLARRKVTDASSGNTQASFRGQGLDFDAVREYVLGDDIRNIDWRVTARTGSPHIKLFKEEKERHTILCVDTNSTMRFGTRNTFKSIQAARSASLLGWRALSHQDRFSGYLFGDVFGGLHSFSSKHSRGTLCKMLKMLTEPPKEHHSVSLQTLLDHVGKVAHSGSLIYLISDFMDLSVDCSKELKRLTQNCEVIFIAINDAADRALVSAGMIAFCGQNGKKTIIDTDSVKEREAYAAQWESNRKALHTLTDRFKIPLVSLSTESDIHRDLLLNLRRAHGAAARY